MRRDILHIGLDVDDNFFTGAIFNSRTGKTEIFRVRPTIGALLKYLKKLQEKGKEFRICYEATYIGYSLCRELRKRGIECEVIAPSLIPVKPGKKVKTDKTDAINLSRYYSRGDLTIVNVPDEEDEAVRSLIRSRSFVVEERKRLKLHILSLCRVHNLNYKSESKRKNYWTQMHIKWLKEKISGLSENLRKCFELLIEQYISQNIIIEEYDREIKAASEKERYSKKVKALNCFRGLDTLSSMTLITEIGDVKRFSHPNKLTCYSGFDIREYSSGGKEQKYGITKMGNKRIRTTLIESCQFNFSEVKISRRLKLSREGAEMKYINIADRCMERLRKKSIMMKVKNKHHNKIKTACAREMLCFIWEALMLAS